MWTEDRGRKVWKEMGDTWADDMGHGVVWAEGTRRTSVGAGIEVVPMCRQGGGGSVV
ncbi:hypothetical protein E2C01_081501 [Portunus trituberculatus]|uniref:Uncharacterized protein n=1 Tax=Portunus trituberculatus TaxID=210409 RepID=A0A5B7IW19_PORTR|nr:hypothetical protein [Portunus trituberculatus]